MSSQKIPSPQEIAYLHGFILGLVKRSEEYESLFHTMCDLETMFCHVLGIPSKLVEWKLIDPPEIADGFEEEE